MKKFLIIILTVFSCAMVSNIFAGNVEVTVRLKKGDVITGKTNLSKITVTTPYGALSIPIEHISDIRFGILTDHTKDGAVLPDLSKLQSSINEADAKVIYERVLAYGTPLLSTIISYTKNTFYRIADRDNYTIEQLIDELYKRANLVDGQTVDDAIMFNGSNYIEGTITFSDISIQSDYGNLIFKRDKIESLEFTPIEDVVQGKDGIYTLKASYHISSNDNNKGWLNTGVVVKKGDKFSITSSGKITLKSLSDGVFNPDGYVSGTKDAAYSEDMNPKFGTVVFKIGENGIAQQAGAQFEGISNYDGVIYISIFETIYNKANSGAYKVKVEKK